MQKVFLTVPQKSEARIAYLAFFRDRPLFATDKRTRSRFAGGGHPSLDICYDWRQIQTIIEMKFIKAFWPHIKRSKRFCLQKNWMYLLKTHGNR